MIMSKIRVCDICGKELEVNNLCQITTFNKFFTFRFVNKLFNHMDICDECAKKIKYLSIDKQDEQHYIDELFSKDPKDFANDKNYMCAYYEGIEDALNVLSHRRLNHIEINKSKII